MTTDICITTQTTYEKDLTPRQVAGGTLQKVGLSINYQVASKEATKILLIQANVTYLVLISNLVFDLSLESV